MQSLISSLLSSRRLEQTGKEFQRMEFLGDSIMNSFVVRYLIDKNQDENEGQLTLKKSKMVQTQSYAKLAKEFGIKGSTEKILENRFEAMIGYMIQRVTYEELYHHLIPYIDLIVVESVKSYKSQLNEYLDKRAIKYKWLPCLVDPGISVTSQIKIKDQIYIGKPFSSGKESDEQLAHELLNNNF